MNTSADPRFDGGAAFVDGEIVPRDKQLAGIDLHISRRRRIAAASVDPTAKNYHWGDLVQSLFAADEVFLSSTGGGVLPIARLDGQPLPQFPGPVTSRLYDAYWAMHDEARYSDPVVYGSPQR
ncbi:MAG: hypothetical protein WAQ05_09845 [Rubrivivax sp.]